MSTPPPSEVVDAARTAHHTSERPAWVDRFVWSALWKVVTVGIVVAVGLYVVDHLSNLLGTLAIALFFALAMIPGVEALVKRFGMPRGAAVGIIYLTALLGLILLVAVLIPAIVRFAETVAAQASTWFAHLNSWAQDVWGGTLIDADAASDGTAAAAALLRSWGDDVLGILTSGFGLVFDLFTLATFAFYFAADWPRIMRALMSRMPADRQRVFKWVMTTSIEQTGGYFYSRLLLMGVCGSTGFVVMLIGGLELVFALPLAVFMGFVSVFIPFIGTYLGAAIPILIMLAVEGVGPAVLLLVWVLIYQQIENYFLSPRLSSKTMELNGAVAFGGALAGGALAGPMGAFMALPVAALITAVIKNSGKTYAVVEDEEPDQAGPPATVSAEPDQAV